MIDLVDFNGAYGTDYAFFSLLSISYDHYFVKLVFLRIEYYGNIFLSCHGYGSFLVAKHRKYKHIALVCRYGKFSVYVCHNTSCASFNQYGRTR